MLKKIGKQSVKLVKNISIIATSSIVGPKEGKGPLSSFFDIVLDDSLMGAPSWEQGESRIVEKSLNLAISKSNLSSQNIDYVFSGDLLDQSIGSTFGVKNLDIPYFGLFSACSSIGEGMSLAAMLIDGEFASNVLVGASSHFCATEKQFRFPLELGTQRPLTSSWTVTGQGSILLSDIDDNNNPKVKTITTGKIVDMNITDANNMGAAMAPAAVDTMIRHFKDLNIGPEYYDLIATGDLGYVGRDIVIELMSRNGYTLDDNYTDCGILIFDKERQDTHSGGSGCACSAVTFAAYLYDRLKKGLIKKLLFIPTGALMSGLSIKQGLSIPGIAHAISIEI